VCNDILQQPTGKCTRICIFQSKNISNFNIDFSVLQTQQPNTVKNRLAQKTAARCAYCLVAIVQGGEKTVDHWRASMNRL